MAFLTFLAPAIVLVLFVTPALLIRRPPHFSAQGDFASSDHVVPKVIQNSSIPYGIGSAALAPLLAWGATGDFWSAVLYATSVGSGLLIIYPLRRPLLEFLSDALHHGRSITVHEFICRWHGNDPKVRAVAALLTMFALAGLVVCEMLAAATVLKPLLSNSTVLTELFLATVLLVVTVCAIWSDLGVTMHALQLQLGLLYLGLFGSTAFLSYLQMSELGTVTANGRFAIALVAVVCTLMIIYRRVRYVDAGSIRYMVSSSVAPVQDRDPVSFRSLSRFGKILNVIIVTFLGLAIGFSAVELYVVGIPVIAYDGLRLLSAPHPTGVALVVFILRALFHPSVDVVNWQRLAALEKKRDLAYSSEHRWTSDFRSLCVTYAVEVTLIVLLIFLFGTIAGLTSTSEYTNVVQDFIGQLVTQENFIATIVMSLFLFALFAMTVSTMSSLFVANMCTLRCDIVPMFSLKPASMRTRARRWVVIVVGTGIGLVVFALFRLGDARYEITLSSNGFLALVVGLCSLQMSFTPLVMGPLIARSNKRGTVSPRCAIAVMGVGALMGNAAVTAYVTTGYDWWLWAAVPGCLGASTLLYLTACFWPRLRRLD